MATSFNTLVQNIVNSDKSYATKRAELTKLGLRSNDIAFVLPREVSAPRVQFIYRYGIELETVCPSFDACEQSLVNNGVSVNNIGRYGHTNNNVRFELKTDSSIRTDNYSERGVEVVSSVLSSTDKFATIKKACKALVDCGARVNTSTGYHVHISTEGMTDEWFSNVFVNYMHAEEVIDTFMANSRRRNNNTYCKSLRGKGLDDCHTIREVNNALCSRYYKVNPQAYYMHRTVEFRGHQGTINAEKVVKWVEFCAALIAWSKNNRLDHDITSIDDMKWLKPAQKTYYKGRAEVLAA